MSGSCEGGEGCIIEFLHSSPSGMCVHTHETTIRDMGEEGNLSLELIRFSSARETLVQDYGK